MLVVLCEQWLALYFCVLSLWKGNLQEQDEPALAFLSLEDSLAVSGHCQCHCHSLSLPVLYLWKGGLQQHDLNPVLPAGAFLPEEVDSPKNDLQ